MKKILFFVLAILMTLPILSQETTTDTNPRNVLRQGFGTHGAYDLGLAFSNPDFITEGSPYFFENWDTKGIIYTKSDGIFKLEKVNINVYSNTLVALYEDSSVFTFDSQNLVKIVINDKVFRVFEIEDEYKFYESIYSDGHAVYSLHSALFSEGSVNPLHNRKTNKYIRKQQYYLYQNNELIKFKVSKKALAKQLATDEVSAQSIVKYIEEAKLSLKNEADVIKVLNFASK